jgi:glycosyltransferase involved in cell wall biosynthesis
MPGGVIKSMGAAARIDRAAEAAAPRRSLSIVVPVLNEVESIESLHDQLKPVLDGIDADYEIIFVNDGSTDGSAEILDRLAERDARVKVLHLRRNYGQTAALMAAIQHSSGDVLVPMDGDLQNDPADIPLLLAKLDEGYDVVSGWRQDRQDRGLSRKLPSRLANRLASRISGVHLHDYGCTLKAYRRSVIENVRLYGEMHRFIPIYAAWQGGRVAELPVRHHARRHGMSKYGLSRAPRVLLDLIVIRFLDRALDRPIQFFGPIGLVSIFLAFLVGLWAVYLKIFEDTSFIKTPLPLLVALLAFVGLICILMGLLAELQTRTYYEAQGKHAYVVARKRNL